MSPAVGPDEARIERTEHGAAATAGWFSLNLADARWIRSEGYGDWDGEFTLVQATWPL